MSEPSETRRTRHRYDRIAPLYDLLESLPERRFAGWRTRLWALVPPGPVLEAGVGTGKNLAHHPPWVEVTGIDLSGRMLERARDRMRRQGRVSHLAQMDVEELGFPAGCFDAAVATFIFCSVADPDRGLRELARVIKPGGRILLLEHVRIDRPRLAGWIMDRMDPVTVRLTGAHINRDTVATIRRAGLELHSVESLGPFGIVKLIVAGRPA